MLVIVIVLAALWLAYGNGANDNFKGVATLYGSDTTTFNGALWWATVTTLAGSLVSVAIAQKLVVTFSGKGLVPDAIAGSPTFTVAVGLGAAMTIFVATYMGMPTSTTHALIGGLLGTGLAAKAEIGTQTLLTSFALPMLMSPILAIAIAAILYLGFRSLRSRLGITKQTCLCVANGSRQPIPVSIPANMNASMAEPSKRASLMDSGLWMDDASRMFPAQSGIVPEIVIDESSQCVERYQGKVIGIEAQTTLNAVHYLSAGAVCFSRAVNDTPKIAALLLTTAVLPASIGIGAVGVAIALGGLIQSRQVAETMSKRITELNPGQGFTANLTTAALVLFASNLGVPVSTTHVSCGAIFGIGAVNRSSQWQTISKILLTWITTLPVAAVISGIVYGLI